MAQQYSKVTIGEDNPSSVKFSLVRDIFATKDETKEQLRIANAKEKDWRSISSQANVRSVQWKKMATDLMERFVETKAELEVTKLPF